VVVVGGGVVGLCIAYYLAASGVPVEVVESAAAGSGASWGNAGWVCLSHSIPVAEPGVVRYALKSLGHPDSPLYVNLRSDPSLAAWLWRFWRSSGRARFAHGYQAMADFNRQTFGLFEELAAAGVETTLRRPGLIHAFLSVEVAEHTLALQRLMAEGRYVLPNDVLVGAAAAQADPALASSVQASYLVEGEGVVDPDRLVAGLVRAVVALGGRLHEQSEVTGFRCSGGLVDTVITRSGEIAASGVVIAAGTASGLLLRRLGYRLPLQVGKGYSFSVDLECPPRHPLYLADKRMVTSPINGTTRLAGTMEFTGHNRDLNWRRLVAIARASRQYLGPWFGSSDELVARIRDPWVGGRPMLPDGLPVIDQLPNLPNAYVATGHGMLGVTYGPATGKALCEYFVDGRRPAVLAPFSFDRIGR
jgi:glycine/D-amino acid oxidase-like deaminating enzyme